MPICEIDGCNNPAKYALYKTFPDGHKEWLNVCKECDNVIGAENIKRAGGYLGKKGWRDR